MAIDMSLLRAVPGLLRLAATSTRRVVEWSITTSLATGSSMARAVAAGQSPTDVLQEATAPFRETARQLLGLPNGDDDARSRSRDDHVGASRDELRARGEALLQRSADVWFADDTHPAYERILGELAPDEARILRFLAIEGPQPAIDVRTSRPLGIGSELVAGGLSMIGLHSGVRYLERTQAYLNNLNRLGLIWFSREEVDPVRYQVVEVQPEVTEVMRSAGRAPKTVRRSIHLTPFGEDFCATCLPIENGSSPPHPAE